MKNNFIPTSTLEILHINITLLFLLILVLTELNAQENIEKKALLNAKKMVEFYNQKDFSNFVDYILPSKYGNDTSNKTQFINFWKMITKNDTAKMDIIKVLKFTKVNNQYQALLLNKFRNEDSYIFGISENNGEKWFFTTSYSKKVQFEQIINEIPTIDTSFAKIVDPKFGKRIDYKIGDSIFPFNYTDIYGNKLSSDSLKGKVIVINFWSISCKPCIMEIPELNIIVEEMYDKDVVFIALAIYSPKEILIDNFLPKHPFKYQIVLINQEDYSITSFPTHIIIDQNLKVIDKFSGYSEENIKLIEKRIKEILE